MIRVSRANARAVLPARFLLVAATNPCPCGGGPPGWCECDEVARLRYLRRLSGPLLDRFDLRVAVQSRPSTSCSTPAAASRAPSSPGWPPPALAGDRAGRLNAALHGELLEEYAPLSVAARAVLREEIERDRLTGRGYHRIRRVARTIADLGGAEATGARPRRRRARRGGPVVAHPPPGGESGLVA